MRASQTLQATAAHPQLVMNLAGGQTISMYSEHLREKNHLLDSGKGILIVPTRAGYLRSSVRCPSLERRCSSTQLRTSWRIRLFSIIMIEMLQYTCTVYHCRPQPTVQYSTQRSYVRGLYTKSTRKKS